MPGRCRVRSDRSQEEKTHGLISQPLWAGGRRSGKGLARGLLLASWDEARGRGLCPFVDSLEHRHSARARPMRAKARAMLLWYSAMLLPLLCSALHFPGRPPHAGPASEPSASRRQLLIGLGAAMGSSAGRPASLASDADATEWQDPRWESLGLKGTYRVTHMISMTWHATPIRTMPHSAYCRHGRSLAHHRGCGGGRYHWPDGPLGHVERTLSAHHSPHGAGTVGCRRRTLEERPCHA